MNYSRFGAICEVDSAKAERKRSESGAKAERKRSESGAKAPLCGHTETGMWRHCLRPKKVALQAVLYMKDLQMCAYCPDSRHVPYFIIHCQQLKLNVDFRGKSVRWSQTPSPLAYAVYAFINVCERPLS